MTKINSPVDVSSYYFAGKSTRSFPRAIEYQGRAVTFASGLQLFIHRGQSVTRLYDMEAEGGAVYRLERQDGQWTLLGMKGAC